jgi:hypothetical protein
MHSGGKRRRVEEEDEWAVVDEAASMILEPKSQRQFGEDGLFILSGALLLPPTSTRGAARFAIGEPTSPCRRPKRDGFTASSPGSTVRRRRDQALVARWTLLRRVHTAGDRRGVGRQL